MPASGDTPGCSVCAGYGEIAFAWEVAVAKGVGPWGQRPANVRAVREVRPLKVGMLLECGTCGAQFVRGEPQAWNDQLRWTIPVTKEQSATLIYWDAHSLRPSPTVFEGLRLIGATRGHSDPLGVPQLFVPCAVELASGERLDPALFQFRRSAPIGYWTSPFVWAPDVRSIGASRFALPPHVRIASTKAQEWGNGFYPTSIVTPDGRDLTLNGVSENFLDLPGVSASTVHLAADDEFCGPEARKRGPVIRSIANERIVWVIADWTEADERLLLPGSK